MNIFVLAALVAFSGAIPSVSYPFNNQLPPIAAWGTAYTYTFSADTFKSSDGSSIFYSSLDLPSWLSLNGRTLSGTPSGNSGEQQVKFTLTASDASGSAQQQCTLQLTSTDLPKYSSASLESVLKAGGAIANSQSYVLVPDSPFSLTFPLDFFSTDGRPVVGHYAVQSDHSPLPIWLNFDGASGRFWGTAPSVNSQIAQAQNFSITYIVSTYEGFESAGASFNLLLGANVLSMNVTKDVIDAIIDKPFTYAAPLSQISLNNVPITPANLSSAKASIPSAEQSWLKWDDTKYILHGTPPKESVNSNIKVCIEIVDRFNDAVSWNVEIQIADETNSTMFSASSLPAANATRGKWFEYNLGDYLLRKDVTLSISGTTSWLKVHNDNFTINGIVPGSFESAMVEISAKLNTGNLERATEDGENIAAHFELYGVGPMISSPSSSYSSISSTLRSTSTSHSPSSFSFQSITSLHNSSSVGATRSRSVTDTGSTASSTSASTSKTPLAPISRKISTNAVAIGCGVGIPVGLIAIAAIALLFCCQKRRKEKYGDVAAAGSVFKRAKKPRDGNGGMELVDGAQISTPRPSSKGMIMAPVFRTESGSGSESDSFQDALEYPGELGDDGTVFGTPKKNANGGFNSPQRASTLNFLAMDGDSSRESLCHCRTLDDNATLASIRPRVTEEYAPPIHREDDDIVSEMPRESWRNTNTGERRWQDARISQSSLASIVPTEPPTVQIVPAEFEAYRPHPEPQYRPISREYSSGVLHRVGSHSSSQYTDSIRTSAAISQRISGHYQTESGTESQRSNEFSDSGSEDPNFRQYIDNNGELHWREEATGGSARLNDVGLDRKPSAAKTPRGDHGEFVFV